MCRVVDLSICGIDLNSARVQCMREDCEYHMPGRSERARSLGRIILAERGGSSGLSAMSDVSGRRWNGGFVSLVEVGERDLWLWLVSPADSDGTDRDWEETELWLQVGSRQAAALNLAHMIRWIAGGTRTPLCAVATKWFIRQVVGYDG